MKIILPTLLAAALIAVPAVAQASGWTVDYSKALDEAKTENKAILLDFTGSDWCPWCIKMDKETLSKAAFREYADQNLILVKLDFPDHTPQPEQVKAQNQTLKQQYQVSGFPTLIILSPTGQILGRQVGYLEGGPDAFLAELSKFYQPAPGTADTSATDEFDAFFHKPVDVNTPRDGVPQP